MTTLDLLENVSLRFSTDKKPGFSRKIVKNNFLYFDLDGKQIKDEKIINRINKLVIPPAYEKVWICPHQNGHLQATGHDARGRKQYRYHPLWTKISQQEKFSHLEEFAKSLPHIRKQLKKDIESIGMNRKKIIATIVWLLENTLIRIGNEEYEKENKSYGLTTLKNRHANVIAGRIVFQFRGKSGVYHNVSLKNKKVAKIVRRCKEIPGQDLFQYFDEEKKIQTISSQDVNDYLREITGADITAKDFRTWGGTLLAASEFDRLGLVEDESENKKNIIETVKLVAGHLRNRPATCRKYYIHPSIINAYTSGFIISNLEKFSSAKSKVKGLDEQENRVLALLRYMVRAEKRLLRN